MNNFVFPTLIGLFAGQIAFNALAIDLEKVAKNNFSKIKQLQQDNRKLLGDIELLHEQQKLSKQKIAELFHLLEYRASNSAREAVVLKLESNSRAAKKIYTTARSLLATGQYDRAIIVFLSYLKRYPDNDKVSDVYYWLAKAYTAKGEHKNAKKIFIDFQKKYPLHPKFANSLYDLAVIKHTLKENKAAMQLLKTMIKKFPNHSDVSKAKTLLASIESN